MICTVPKVTVTTWNAKNVVLAGPTYRRYLEKTLLAVKNKDIASVIGQPGMGKTTILRKTQEEAPGLTFFLDLASKAEIEDEFWGKVDQFKIRELVLPTLRGKANKLGYGFLRRLTGVKLEDWLLKVCNKYDDIHLRLFCSNYPKDFDGMLKFLGDLKNVIDVNLMVDEVRDSHIPKIHRLINAGLGIPVIMAIPTDSYSKVTDLAVRRRLDESRVSLDTVLTQEDIKEIIDAYCHPLAEDLFPIIYSLWSGGELNTVSSMLQYVKSQVENFERECGDNLDCFREKLRSSHSLKNPEEDSREMEKMVREVLSSEGKEMGISYVHPRGKRVEANGKFMVVGIFFIKDEQAVLGQVKLMKDDRESDDEINLLPEVRTVEHEKRNYPVGKRFVITNSAKLKVPNSVNKIEISTFEAVRILRGDGEILREIVRPLQDLPGAGRTPVESTA
ncbi:MULTISPECIES: hypothetical protein [Metallosphaera]|uniref:Uncharacterized protein n=3 Tax=Metallosphaera TaxID=41980 RepID=A4YF33_METS5|nr:MULTISPECIES: hypothetical protein [Metallosphaera]ABP95035.1 hypothetical protein Msed_0862 [Metallosphaera sedula DSM 5348]AIM27021.1 hypothetical protein HA72_0862 [Metallosphaera sedula]AKV73940.1 ATPase AAA [Metallosphaera sedula]AKV76179.1 ATPase AAA [Metallosphaera sedula]AKV78431.1 ATPase AAA [Metallosphaera sedula]